MTATFVFLHGSNGFAIAPVVDDPGDIIIGDLEVVTGGGVSATRNFIYPDALGFDILDDGFVNDADDDLIDLKWSFAQGEFVDGVFVGSATDTININGVGPLDPGLSGIGQDDPTEPDPTSTITHDGAVDNHEIQDSDGDGNNNGDGDANTLTFRNVTLTGIGPGNARLAGTDGQVISTETVTLFASDGSTFGWTTVTVFTANGTSDSAATRPSELIPPRDFGDGDDPSDPVTEPPEGLWLAGDTIGNDAAVVEFIDGRGLCITHLRATTEPEAQGGWVTPAGFLDLVDGLAYQVRMTVTGSETDPLAMPLWNLVYNNNNTDPGTGVVTFNFAGEMIVQPAIADTTGGNNAGDEAGGRQTFESYIFPFAGATPQWDGMFTPEIGSLADMSLLFRLNQGGAQPTRTGQVCLEGWVISTVPLSGLSGATVFNSAIVGNNVDTTNFLDAGSFVTDGTFAQSSATGSLADTATTVVFGSGTATVQLRSNTPDGDASALELLPYAPSFFGDFEDTALFPIVWESDQLYDAVWSMSSSGPGDSPVDVMIGIIKAPDVEISQSHVSLSGLPGFAEGLGSPNGNPADFHSLFFSHTAAAGRPGLQPSIQFFNSPALGIGGDVTLTGDEDVIIHSLTITRIDPSTFGLD
jgi:hypothetical protein